MSQCKTVENLRAAERLLHDCTGGYKDKMTITEVSESIGALMDVTYYLNSLTKHLHQEIADNAKSQSLYFDDMKEGDVYAELEKVQSILAQSADISGKLSDNYSTAFQTTHHVGSRN